jgi:cytochrome c
MKRRIGIAAGLAIAGCLFVTAVSANAPASFGACAACHSIDGSARLGPTLKGVIGRRAGTGSGFTYSAAMKGSGLTWDEKSLDAFLADPQKAVPGNTMPFPSVADAKQRSEIVEYLKSVK